MKVIENSAWIFENLAPRTHNMGAELLNTDACYEVFGYWIIHKQAIIAITETIVVLLLLS